MNVLLPFLAGVFFSNALRGYLLDAPAPGILANGLLAIAALVFSAIAIDAYGSK